MACVPSAALLENLAVWPGSVVCYYMYVCTSECDCEVHTYVPHT